METTSSRRIAYLAVIGTGIAIVGAAAELPDGGNLPGSPGIFGALGPGAGTASGWLQVDNALPGFPGGAGNAGLFHGGGNLPGSPDGPNLEVAPQPQAEGTGYFPGSPIIIKSDDYMHWLQSRVDGPVWEAAPTPPPRADNDPGSPLALECLKGVTKCGAIAIVTGTTPAGAFGVVGCCAKEMIGASLEKLAVNLTEKLFEPPKPEPEPPKPPEPQPEPPKPPEPGEGSEDSRMTIDYTPHPDCRYEGCICEFQEWPCLDPDGPRPTEGLASKETAIESTGNAIATSIREFGIPVTIIPNAQAQFGDRLGVDAGYATQLFFVSPESGGLNNMVNYRNAEMDASWAGARVGADSGALDAMLVEIQDIPMSYGFGAPVVEHAKQRDYSDRFEGMQWPTYNSIRFFD